ncbi:transcription factor E4F1 [Nilaparvata lugens]|uniref:transcription factor E4F1 n=1 Tax=Nilaparvata lugens TaxID=108931 RepID=UPI00193D4183|nr:transcription factor E4F1 [Nilaparvata lugens]
MMSEIKVEFINCGEVSESDMIIQEEMFDDTEVKVEEVKVEEYEEGADDIDEMIVEEDPLAVPLELFLQPESSTPAGESSGRPVRKRSRKVIYEAESLRSTRRISKRPKTTPVPKKTFWCFGVPRIANCELCFGGCLPLRCRKCKVIRDKTDIIKSYDCGECGLSFRDIPQFKEHMKSEHVNLTCNDCGKTFPNKARLKSHSLIHREKKFLCELCSSAFQRSDQYKAHYLRKHTDARDFRCVECGKFWKTKGDLTQHMRVHDDRYRPRNRYKKLKK